MTTLQPTTRTNLGQFFNEGARKVWLDVVVKRGLSQEDIRRAIGLGRGMVSRYLYGDREISLKIAFRIEDAWGIDARLWTQPAKRRFVPPTVVRVPTPRGRAA